MTTKDGPTLTDTDRAMDLHSRMCGSLHTRFPLLGIARALHHNRRGAPISFSDRPYLIPLYAWIDILREASFCKAPQTGISELLIQKVLHDAGWRNRICAYVMPQYKTSERFVDDRLNPLLVEVPAYAARVPGGEHGTESTKSKGNLKRKRFGPQGSLLFLGSNTPSDFLEFSADTVVVDEYDECDLDNVGKVWDRVRESPFPQVFTVSNPSGPDVGIHKMWKAGSRARWHQRCNRCGERQPLDWEANVVRKSDDGRWVPRDTARSLDPAMGDIRPVCRRCKQPWERDAVGSTWVAEFPEKHASFHISRLDMLANAIEPQPLRQYYAEWVRAQGDSGRLAKFFPGVLGFPFEQSGTRVTQADLDGAMDGQPDNNPHGGEFADKTVVLGCDVGTLLHVSISELVKGDTPSGYIRKGLFVGTVPQFEDLRALIDAFHVDAAVIDAMPETRKCKELRDHYVNEGTCEVWLCRYHPSVRIGTEAFGLVQDYEEHVVTVDRTQLLDCTMDELRNGTRRLPGDAATVLGFSDQMKAPVRVLDEKAQRFVWREGSDADHFRHADAYERVAMELYDRSGGYFEG